MTIREAIDRMDSLKHNTYTDNEKVAWLSRLDSMINILIISANNGKRGCGVYYDPNTDMETPLLVGEPFDDIYLKWLEAQIDYANGEIEKYNNAILMYQTVYDSYANYYRRTHMPAGKKYKFF